MDFSNADVAVDQYHRFKVSYMQGAQFYNHIMTFLQSPETPTHFN